MYDLVDEPTFRQQCTAAVWAYTDGSTAGTGHGGWGALIGSGRIAIERYGASARGATSMRMELLAVVRTLEFIGFQDRKTIDVFTDCQRLVEAVDGWLPAQVARRFQTDDGRLMADSRLWRVVADATGRHKLRLHWVRSHGADRRNQRADELAREGLGLLLPRDEKGFWIKPSSLR